MMSLNKGGRRVEGKGRGGEVQGGESKEWGVEGQEERGT